MGSVFEELKAGLKLQEKFSEPSCCACDLEVHVFISLLNFSFDRCTCNYIFWQYLEDGKTQKPNTSDTWNISV